VHIGELPPSDDEDEEEEEEVHHAKIADTHGDNENKITRKGTGFVHIGELPPSDDEDEEEEEEAAVVRFDRESIDDGQGQKSTKVRKSGFVKKSDLPPEEEEDDEDDDTAAQTKKVVMKVDSEQSDDDGESEDVPQSTGRSRKGTGFVRASDLAHLEDDGDDE